MARAGISGCRRHSTLRLAALSLTSGLLLAGLAGCSAPVATESTRLVYEGPQAYTVRPGDLVPGTDTRYVGRTAEGAEFLVAGQRIVKQKADSLDWAGSPVPGVELDLKLRIIWFTEDALYAAGKAELTISDVAPRASAIPGDAPLSYQAPVHYSVPVEGTLPGTTLTYEGEDAAGAQFSGVDGYPYRRQGDSLRWEGWVRSNVAVKHELRLVQHDEQSARLMGVVRLWIVP